MSDPSFSTGLERYRNSPCYLRSTLLDDIREHWDKEGTECPFVDCEIEEPTYRVLTSDEKSYYFYWRSMVRKGKFLKTSRGYLYLFVNEIINTETNAEANLKNLVNVVKVYGSLDRELADNMSEAAYVYAKINRLPVPEVDRVTDPYITNGILTSKLKEKPIGRLTFNVLRGIVPKTDWKRLDEPDTFESLFTECVRRIDAYETDRSGKRIAEFDKPLRYQVNVYPYFRYYGSRKRIAVDSLNFSEGSKYYNFMRGTFKCLLNEVLSSKRLMVSYYGAYPLDYKTIVFDLVSEWKKGIWKPEDLEFRGMVLDMDSVSSAMKDLDAISKLMEADYAEEEQPSVSETAEKRTLENPWSELVSLLDGDSIKYLKGSMEGNAKKVLKELGVRMTSVEEKINGLAMETVEDVIVEDGIIVDEYLALLKEVL